MLENPAVSGLAIEIGWSALNPNPPAPAPNVSPCADTAPPAAGAPYDWRIIDSALCAIDTWNQAHPSETAKTLQLMLAPGFWIPGWALAQMPPSCDGLFQDPPLPPSGTCGWATFLNAEGTAHPALQPLPLPWEPTYKRLWGEFLATFAARYGENVDLVSIAVAGPSAKTYEIIEPNGLIPPGSTGPSGAPPPYPIPSAGLSQTWMWSTLLASPSADPVHHAEAAYNNTDQIFIDEWNAAIDLYGETFHGITLVLSTGNGLPSFPQPGPSAPPAPALAADCAGAHTMDCAAETNIQARLMDPSVGGANAKAIMMSGMAASRANDDLGIAGVKRLAGDLCVSPRILGGSEFNTSFSARPFAMGCPGPIPPNPLPKGCTLPAGCVDEGCNLPASCIPPSCAAPGGIPEQYLSGYYLYDSSPSGKPSNAVPAQYLMSPEQALYNNLALFFSRTPAAHEYAAPDGPARMNFLFIYAADLLYAMNAAGTPVAVTDATGAVRMTTAEDELTRASQQLLAIAYGPSAP